MAGTPAPRGAASPAARLAKAIVKVDDHPFPSRISAPTRELFDRIAPHGPAALRPLLTRASRADSALAAVLKLTGPETAAMTRTTAVTTTLHGAPAHNVIPASATAHVNVRILVGDTLSSVEEHLRKAIGDSKVELELVSGDEPSPVSPVDDDAFRLLERVIDASFPDAVTTPYVMMAATDARHFCAITPRVYRFAPFRMSKPQRQAIHSYDEHIGIDDFVAGVDWYHRLIQELPG